MKISSYMEGVFENSDLTQGEIDYILENVRRLEAVAEEARWVRHPHAKLAEALRALEDADG